MIFSVGALSLFLEQVPPSVVSYYTEGNCKKRRYHVYFMSKLDWIEKDMIERFLNECRK